MNIIKLAEQEPVVVHQFRKLGCADWYDGLPDHEDGYGPYEARILYTAPQPRRQPLTDEEIMEIVNANAGYGGTNLERVARATEAAVWGDGK
jgi:hypothetical protein